MFKAKFINQKTGAEYWRTVWADDTNEATKLASRFAKSGFILASLINHNGAL